MADDDKEPRWANDPPIGFDKDGKYLGVPKDQYKPIVPKIIGPDGKLYTEEEWIEKQNSELDLDSMSVEELQALVDGLEESITQETNDKGKTE